MRFLYLFKRWTRRVRALRGVGFWCLAFLLAACGTPVDEQNEVGWKNIGGYSNYVKLIEVDGIRCVVFDGYSAGGISCDWSDR